MVGGLPGGNDKFPVANFVLMKNAPEVSAEVSAEAFRKSRRAIWLNFVRMRHPPPSKPLAPSAGHLDLTQSNQTDRVNRMNQLAFIADDHEGATTSNLIIIA